MQTPTSAEHLAGDLNGYAQARATGHINRAVLAQRAAMIPTDQRLAYLHDLDLLRKRAIEDDDRNAVTFWSAFIYAIRQLVDETPTDLEI